MLLMIRFTELSKFKFKFFISLSLSAHQIRNIHSYHVIIFTGECCIAIYTIYTNKYIKTNGYLKHNSCNFYILNNEYSNETSLNINDTSG